MIEYKANGEIIDHGPTSKGKDFWRGRMAMRATLKKMIEDRKESSDYANEQYLAGAKQNIKRKFSNNSGVMEEVGRTKAVRRRENLIKKKGGK